MNSRKIRVNGLRLHLNFWGNPTKPKLFLLHGWLDCGASFYWLCQHLKKNFYCIAPDLRGYGKSKHTISPLGYFFYEYVADLHEILEKIAPGEKVRLLGHSLGGMVASIYAGVYPEKVSHLINVEGFGIKDTPPSKAPQRVKKWIEGIHQKQFKIYKNRKEFAQRLTLSFPRIREDQALFLAHYLGKKVRGGIINAADPKHKLLEPYPFHLKNTYAFWKNIQARCLLISAKKTEMAQWIDTPGGVHRAIRERLSHFPKGSKKVMIKNCGHMAHLEKPKELAQAIDSFIKK